MKFLRFISRSLIRTSEIIRLYLYFVNKQILKIIPLKASNLFPHSFTNRASNLFAKSFPTVNSSGKQKPIQRNYGSGMHASGFKLYAGGAKNGKSLTEDWLGRNVMVTSTGLFGSPYFYIMRKCDAHLQYEMKQQLKQLTKNLSYAKNLQQGNFVYLLLKRQQWVRAIITNVEDGKIVARDLDSGYIIKNDSVQAVKRIIPYQQRKWPIFVIRVRLETDISAMNLVAREVLLNQATYQITAINVYQDNFYVKMNDPENMDLDLNSKILFNYFSEIKSVGEAYPGPFGSCIPDADGVIAPLSAGAVHVGSKCQSSNTESTESGGMRMTRSSDHGPNEYKPGMDYIYAASPVGKNDSVNVASILPPFILVPLKMGKTYEVKLGYQDEKYMFVRLQNTLEEMDKMLERVGKSKDYMNSLLRANLKVGDAVLAADEEVMKRAKILEIEDDGHFRVLFVDYGYISTVVIGDLREIPSRWKNVPVYTYKIVLENDMPLNGIPQCMVIRGECDEDLAYSVVMWEKDMDEKDEQEHPSGAANASPLIQEGPKLINANKENISDGGIKGPGAQFALEGRNGDHDGYCTREVRK